jgi:hypothetical protein
MSAASDNRNGKDNKTMDDLFTQEPLASLIEDGLLFVSQGQLFVPGDLTAEEEAELAARLQDPRKLN